MSDIKPLVTVDDGDDEADEVVPGLFDYVWPVVVFPLTLSLKFLSLGFRLIRPFSPQLVPLVVIGLLFPVLLSLSFYSGFYVWSNVAVGWRTPIFLQYGDVPMPYAEADLPLLVTHQPYDVSLQLVVPISEANIALGNFMTSLTLSTPSNKTLATVRRSALVIPGSSWPLISVFQTPGTTRVTIPLLQSYVPNTSKVIARLNLGRQDGWKGLGTGEGRELSVLSATLTGTLRHEGIRGLVTRFPLLFGCLASATFLLISFVTVAALLLPTIGWRLHHDAVQVESGLDETPKKPDKRASRLSQSRSDDEKRVRKPKSISTSRSRSARSGRMRSMHEAEAPVTTMSSADQAIPLRRRKSRLDTYSGSE